MSTTAAQPRESVLSKPTKSILQRIAEGDRHAVGECIDQYGPLIWYLARRYCTSHAEAEDAVQEIFIEVWQKAATYDPSIASDATFLTMIARRRLIDRRRRQDAGVQCMGGMDLNLEVVDTTPGQSVELEDEAAKALSCMDKLSGVQRSVLTMNICQGHSQTAIAELLSLPVGTVKSFARRGLIFLRDCMSRPASSMIEGRSL